MILTSKSLSTQSFLYSFSKRYEVPFPDCSAECSDGLFTFLGDSCHVLLEAQFGSISTPRYRMISIFSISAPSIARVMLEYLVPRSSSIHFDFFTFNAR